MSAQNPGSLLATNGLVWAGGTVIHPRGFPKPHGCWVDKFKGVRYSYWPITTTSGSQWKIFSVQLVPGAKKVKGRCSTALLFSTLLTKNVHLRKSKSKPATLVSFSFPETMSIVTVTGGPDAMVTLLLTIV